MDKKIRGRYLLGWFKSQFEPDVFRALPFRAARRIRWLVSFKSQIGQDMWVIFRALPFKRKGFFLDLGAGDGVELSNTYVLKKLFGWKGICIEPNPGFHAKLKKRRNCIIDYSVVNDKSKKVDFRIDNYIYGGIVAEDTVNNIKTYGKGIEIMTATTCTLTEVLDRHNAPKVIDYFSLDVEGSETRVLKGLDFNKYSFNCLTIEQPTLEVHQILIENDYVFVKKNRWDAYYVHKSLLTKSKMKCEPFKQTL